VGHHKREQRQTLIFRQLAPLLQELFNDQAELELLSLSRIELSADGSICTLLFAATNAQTFEKHKRIIELYKPSIRKAVASILQSKKTPYLRFEYDKGLEHVRHINNLLEKIKSEDQAYKDEHH
jgi:ribosome-binding factor A